MNCRRLIDDRLAAAAGVMLLLQREAETLDRIGKALVKTLRGGRRIYLLGNGGSAADAQHIAAELEGRFMRERRALPVLALTTNTSTLTAVGNDYGFERTFSRQVEAHVGRGDALIAISTSGNSENVIAAVRAAKKAGALTIGFTNDRGGRLRRLVDHCLRAPTLDTQRTQECHITAGHILCDVIETSLFG